MIIQFDGIGATSDIFHTALVLAFSYGQTPPVNSIFIVNSDSILPNLHQYDTVVVDSHFPFYVLRIADIITFKTFGTRDSRQNEIIA